MRPAFYFQPVQHDPYRNRAQGQVVMGLIVLAVFAVVYVVKALLHW